MENKETYHVLDLPSRLKVYKDVKEISIRFLKGKDEKLLGGLTISNWDKKYNILLNQVLKGIDPRELTLGDRTYIAIWLSANCYSHIYPIETLCLECFAKVKVKVDLKKLEKVYLSEDFVEPEPVELLDGTVIPMRLLRVKDQISYLDYIAKAEEDRPNFKLALTMENDMTLAQRLAFLDNLDTKDLGILRNFHDKHVHGVNLDDYAFECPKCKEAGTTPVPFRFEMLVPDNETVSNFARDGV
jgi:hypothetical protein